MADTTTTVQWTIDYQNDSTEKRTYEIDVVSEEIDSAAVIQEINASIDASTAGDLQSYFVDSQGNPMNRIIAARRVTKSEQLIF